ncbi:hypothetical protein Hanom_Chr13g01243711 [Helianthus anomalus]
MCLCMMACTFEVFAALPFKLVDRTGCSIGLPNRSASNFIVVRMCHSIGWHARSGDIPMF